MANALGATMTDFWGNLTTSDAEYYDGMAANEWVVTDRLDAETGRNFTSWQDFFGPADSYNGDNFTKTVRPFFNLTAEVYSSE